MKKIILFLSVFLISTSVYASGAGNTFPPDIPRTDIMSILNIIINALIGLSGAIAVWFLILGGFQYVTSAGNPDSVQKAKSTILYAIIGLIVVIISYAAVNFIIGSF